MVNLMLISLQMLFHNVVNAANHCLRAHTCKKSNKSSQCEFAFFQAVDLRKHMRRLKMEWLFSRKCCSMMLLMQQTTVCGLTRVSNCHFLSCPPLPLPSITLQKIQNSVIAFLWKMNFKMIYQPFSPRIFFESKQKGCSVRITVTVTMQISLAGTKQSYTKPAVLTYISQKQLPHLPKNFIKCNQCDYEYIRECNARRQMKTNQAAFTCNAQNQFSVWQQLTNSDDPEWSFPVKKQNSLSSRFFYEYLQTISKGNVLSQINHSLPSPFLFPVSSFIGGDLA